MVYTKRFILSGLYPDYCKQSNVKANILINHDNNYINILEQLLVSMLIPAEFDVFLLSSASSGCKGDQEMTNDLRRLNWIQTWGAVCMIVQRLVAREMTNDLLL